ncbi:MAG: divalent-cation tolerance protein CutA [Verrucomicrobiota bacterium]
MDQKSEKSRILLVLSTFPDAETARQIGTKLVEGQLAACVNVLPGVESIYRWKGAVETESEVLAIIKTTASGLGQLKDSLSEWHPYDVPEIIALDVADGSASYLEWVAANVAVSSE